MVRDIAVQNPDSVAVITNHVNGDGFETAWGQARLDVFYGLFSAVPTLMVDGVWNCPAADYQVCVQQQMAQPTDVTLELSGNHVQGDTWDITARVCLESGSSRSLRIYTAPTLNNHPSPTLPDYTTHLLMQNAFETDITLQGGGCENVTTQITFDPLSAANTSDIVIIAWAQDPSSTGPASVHQAGTMRWPFPAGEQLTTIEITPADVTLAVGETVDFTAVGKDQFGADFPLENPTWSLGTTGTGDGTFDPSSGSAVTSFTATTPGTRQILCSDQGVSGAAIVTVTEAPVLTTIEIDPATVEVDLDGEVSFTAAGKDQFGADFPLSNPMWSLGSTGTGDGTFDPSSGSAVTTFTATTPGTRQILCSDQGVIGAAIATVTEAPVLTTIEIDPATVEVDLDGAVNFTAAGKDQFGVDFPLDDPVWTVSGTGDGTFDPTTGTTTVFTATTVGSCTVKAAEGGVEGAAQVEIVGEAPYLASIVLDPASAQMRIGDELAIGATGKDQYGDDFALTDPTWRVEGDGDGTFDPTTGTSTTFTATAVGSAQIICAEDGVEGAATVVIAESGLPAPRKATGRVAP